MRHLETLNEKEITEEVSIKKKNSSFKNDAEKHAEMKEKYELLHIATNVLNFVCIKKINI